jgi:uroporphyrinogen decarboxylase
MKSKDRVLNSLNRKSIDRIPVFATVTPQIGDRLCDVYDLSRMENVKSGMRQRIIYCEVLNQLGNDCVGVAACYPGDFIQKSHPDGSFEDEWGIRWKNNGIYDEMVFHPLFEIEEKSDLDRFVFPNPDIQDRFDLASKMIDKYGTEYAIVGMQDSVNFELAWYLTGMEKFLTDMILKKDYIPELLNRILEIKITEAKILAGLGVDIIWTGDDIGEQNGMMISPDIWREVLKPYLRTFISTLHGCNKKLKIAYHSCGSILPIIPDLIEIGVDILNPIQTNARGMDPHFLKKNYGNNICFFGGIDVQNLLPRSKPEIIYKEVQNILRILGENGGYLAAPSHNIQPDTPLENIIAMFKAILDYKTDYSE